MHVNSSQRSIVNTIAYNGLLFVFLIFYQMNGIRHAHVALNPEVTHISAQDNTGSFYFAVFYLFIYLFKSAVLLDRKCIAFIKNRYERTSQESTLSMNGLNIDIYVFQTPVLVNPHSRMKMSQLHAY